MVAELGSYKQAHTSLPPLTLGNSRVVEGPAHLKELGSRAQAVHGGPLAMTATQTTLHRSLVDLPVGEPTGRREVNSQELLTAPPLLPSDAESEGLLTAAVQASPQLALPPQTTPISVQLQQLSKEKQSVEAELQRCQEAEREARERVRRLERLVEVLRKKVGTGNLRAVI
ncbi:hypothetical protein L3Q82_008121 [Scortum barcoo]|uniref:Uncharacterized protein n=1 Tax=Scortum barcoo TaxID=214431 RepID=A0ACB8WGV7_9TELE|nr:hypothetical protein L3Q82_008121 [Scortum barcoo]